ncbi:RHS repeat domain-containing protein [Pseudomonas sp. RT4P38]
MNSVHRHTPALNVTDSRGLPVRQVSYLRRVVIDAPVAHVTRQQHDAAGRQVAQRDPRLKVPNLVTLHSLSGAALCTGSVDAGWRLGLPGEAQQAVERWDGRGSHWRIEYDEQRRPVAIHEQTNGQPPQALERLSYANADAEFADRNQCGQLRRHDDAAGVMLLDQRALTGEVISQTRRFLPDAQMADWPLDEAARDTLLEPDKRYITRQRYSPLGELIRQTDAGDHQQRWSFNRAGQLNGIELTLNGKDAQALLTATDYNAAGQLLSQTAGNRVTTLATFEPDSGRLSHLSAAAPGKDPLQNLSYNYDPVGNISLLMDHLQTVGYFANQRVAPETTYTYDSLYQLASASGREAIGASIQPGLPELISPIDPSLLLNYTQEYEYDEGGNLTVLRHQRSGNHYTRTMRVADDSNRAVPWQEGDPDPDFRTRFDRNGNLQTLMPGTQPMTWDGRNQLQELITVYRANAANDGEYYRYDSQGARVRKVHLAQAKTVAHRREARYLPNVEIRTLDSSEELHVISVPLGYGNVRCLHWVKGKPDLIEADQLRYSLNDHLGSSTLELDKNAAIISHEGYYPYGGTAWWAARSTVEADYKTIRYSGKEMDVSGLYYYGLRYYAPWLQRWISADPAGDVDGLNLYAFVGNNPLFYVDSNGTQKEKHEIYSYALFISSLASNVIPTLGQIEKIADRSGIPNSLLKNTLSEGLSATAAFFGGFYASEAIGSLLSGVDINLDPFVVGFIGGNAGGDLVGESEAAISAPFKRVRPLIPQTSTMTIAEIDRQAGLDVSSNDGSVLDQGILTFLGRFVGSVVPGVNALMALGARAQEAEDIKNGLTPSKIDKIEKMLGNWKTTTEQRWAEAKANFEQLGTDVIYPADIIPNVNNMTPKSMLQPIHLAGLEKLTKVTLAKIGRSEERMRLYKEAGTTDNRFLERNRRRAT